MVSRGGVTRVIMDTETYTVSGRTYFIGAIMSAVLPSGEQVFQSFPFGIGRYDGSPSVEDLRIASDEVASFLEDTLLYLSSISDYVFVIGYNHTEYDLPLLYMSVGGDLMRFHDNIIHVDLHDVVLAMRGFRPGGTSLRSVVKDLGIVRATYHDVDVQSAVSSGDFEAVYNHLLEDVVLIRKLFNYFLRRVGKWQL